MKNTNDAIQKLISGFEQLETPLGKLPIAFNQLILLFPMAVAGVFLVCSSLLIETMRLRREFHDLYRTGNILTDQQVSIIAPLWIDPISHKHNQIIKFIILLVPFVIFVVSLYLIFTYNWTIQDTLFNDKKLNQMVYGGLYIMTAIIISSQNYVVIHIRACMQVIPVTFSTEHREMLGHAKMLMESGMVAINPAFDKLVTALSTVIENQGSLDKESTSYNDILDAFRLSLKMYEFKRAKTEESSSNKIITRRYYYSGNRGQDER